jgi:hypothetical protein
VSAPREVLKELAAKWKDEADMPYSDSGERMAFNQCARELEATLATPPAVGEGKHGDVALAIAYDSGYQAGLLAAKIAIRNLMTPEGASDEQS